MSLKNPFTNSSNVKQSLLFIAYNLVGERYINYIVTTRYDCKLRQVREGKIQSALRVYNRISDIGIGVSDTFLKKGYLICHLKNK